MTSIYKPHLFHISSLPKCCVVQYRSRRCFALDQLDPIDVYIATIVGSLSATEVLLPAITISLSWSSQGYNKWVSRIRLANSLHTSYVYHGFKLCIHQPNMQGRSDLARTIRCPILVVRDAPVDVSIHCSFSRRTYLQHRSFVSHDINASQIRLPSFFCVYFTTILPNITSDLTRCKCMCPRKPVCTETLIPQIPTRHVHNASKENTLNFAHTNTTAQHYGFRQKPLLSKSKMKRSADRIAKLVTFSPIPSRSNINSRCLTKHKLPTQLCPLSKVDK